MSQHHDLDIYPIPEGKKPLLINEPWLIDTSLYEITSEMKQPEAEEDNVRVYIPLDLNRQAILRRLERVIAHYGEANEKNEFDFSMDVDTIISQIEIYDQIWYGREVPERGKHSLKAVKLVREVIDRLEEIPDGCAECFPFETIDELKREYCNIPFET